ncbi:MAG: GMP synthase (glutamine-hydrolyzing) [Planctomycetota bacterium]|jgi:GMP synthase (glutamine-hydrolysing)
MEGSGKIGAVDQEPAIDSTVCVGVAVDEPARCAFRETSSQSGEVVSTQAKEIQTFRFEYPIPEDPADFEPADFTDKAIAWVNDLVEPGEKIALSASGGVDSTVAAFLLNRIAGAELHPFFIEDGCRRLIGGKPEGEVTRKIFGDLPNFSVLEVRDEVLPPLIGLSDGEEKRKNFISNYKKISDQYIQKIGADWIADGTIAPDIIETEGGFKSQHNVGWSYTVRKLEPLASLAKPQVRKVGEHLGLPASFTHRIPCPGPAQIVRTVGLFSEEKLNVSQHATDLIEQLVETYYEQKEGKPYLYDETTGIRTPFQYFGVALDPGMEPDEELTNLANGILGTDTKCFRMTNRTTVVPEAGTRPEIPIYEPVSWVHVTGDIDYDKLESLCQEAWTQLELPRILLQLHQNPEPKTELVVGIRVVESAAAKEARPIHFEQASLLDMGKRVAEHSGASRVAYDISLKPPATIEYE